MNSSTIIATCCRFFGVTPAHLFRWRDGRNQHVDIRHARHVAMWLLRGQQMSYPQIARAFGLSDHTSCMHGVRVVARDERLLACAAAIQTWLAGRNESAERMAA